MITDNKAPLTGANNEVFAVCYCGEFDFGRLQPSMLQSNRCVAFRKALLVEWKQGEIFIFDYGVVVFWHLSLSDRTDFLLKIHDFAKDIVKQVIEDEFTFELTSDRDAIKNDHISIGDREVITRLAISHGIAQSTKLMHFEYQVQQTISDTVQIPENIAKTGSSNLRSNDLAKLRGRLYITKSDVMLNYDLLDVPDFFWDYPELEKYYTMVIDYLEVKQRVEVLSKKLETIHELFGMIADELRHKHSSLLEWIIIWLIAFEIAVFFIHDVFALF